VKTSTLLGISALVVLTFVPAGLRALSWKNPKPHDLDPSTVRAGQMLFKHEWKPQDPLAKGGDGLGPVFNATSCIACHNQGGVGGAGGLGQNVTTFTVRAPGPREGVLHAFAVRPLFLETLDQISPGLPPRVSRPSLGDCRSHSDSGVHLSQRNTPALFGARLIDGIPDRVIIANEKAQQLRWAFASPEREDLPVGRALRLADGRVGHFGWKAQSASLADFVQAACANELGLGNPGRAQPAPLSRPTYGPRGLDLTLEQCDQITSFLASLNQPVERLPESAGDRELALAGKRVFVKMGCADCHQPNVGDVIGLYSDLLLHRMGEELVGGGSYNEPLPPIPDKDPGERPHPGEWRTPPLWGVADSAPYLHDGRAATLEEAIAQHGGQGARSAQAFAQGGIERSQLIGFLKTLRAP
jgi:CxxC motif-containing protein (DUF1111 family)